MGSDFRRIVLEAIVIAALGGVIGLSINHRLILASLQGKGAVPTSSPALPESLHPAPAGLEEVRLLLEGGALAVDARDGESFRRGHLPGAVSLPLEDVAEGLPAFRRTVPAEKILVVYCSGYGCSDSFDLAVRLLTEGYRDVRVFEGGLPAWEDAGLPVDGGGS